MQSPSFISCASTSFGFVRVTLGVLPLPVEEESLAATMTPIAMPVTIHRQDRTMPADRETAAPAAVPADLAQRDRPEDGAEDAEAAEEPGDEGRDRQPVGLVVAVRGPVAGARRHRWRRG